ncbi:hypothetical protein BKA64DRAFT_701643 [Cadophora sp. MPI-SDFR-AT-0126]|nr:hypothetical protein BKA64DRAFT_701643 [Leotiomycetes sp. MPI-SDFR-AT-0126]
MSANPAGGGLSTGYSAAQLELAKSLRDSMTPAGSKSRPGRGRSSAPSPATSAGRGRGGYATASTRSVASNTPSASSNYQSLGSSTASRTTHAPGATKSGAINPHFAQYSVGATTAAPAFKSPPRTRTVSPIRSSGPAAVPVLKPKSPTKLRNTILVPSTAQPTFPPSGNKMNGGPPGQVHPQSGCVNVPEQASACVYHTPAAGGSATAQISQEIDPRFTAVPSSHPMAQQPSGSFFGGHNQNPPALVQTVVPSTQAHASFGSNQGQGPVPHAVEMASQAAPPDSGRVRITTNWTDDDQTKPIIPGHLRQPDGEKVITEIAGNVGLPASNLGQGVMTVGISSSIHAPGNYSASRANSTRYQSDVNDSQWMAAASNRNHETGTKRIPSGDGDVEMSDVQANTRSSSPQGPVEWNNLPTLAASKYASPATLTSNPPNVPKPAPTTSIGIENIKPTQQVPDQGFGGLRDINKNIAADLAKNSGFNGAPGQPSFNPFIGNGDQAIHKPSQVSGFGAAASNSAGFNPFQNSAVGSGWAQPVGPVTHASNGFGAPSGPASGPVNGYSANGHNSLGVSHFNDATAQMIQNTSNLNQNGFGPPSTLPPWESVDHSASNAPFGFSTGGPGAIVQPSSQSTQSITNGFGAQAPGGLGLGAQYASNGQSGMPSSGFGLSQNGPAGQSATNAPDSYSSNVQTVHGFGGPQSASMGQVNINPFMSNGPGASSQPNAPGLASVNPFMSNGPGASFQPTAAGQVNVNPFLSNGSGANSQPPSTSQGANNNPFMSNGGPSTQAHSHSRSFGAPATNVQPAKASGHSGHGGFDAAKLAASIDNDLRRMYSGKAAGPTYEASPFEPAIRSAVAPNASGNGQPGSGPPVYQVVPESKKATGLAASRWA